MNQRKVPISESDQLLRFEIFYANPPNALILLSFKFRMKQSLNFICKLSLDLRSLTEDQLLCVHCKL